MSDNMYSWINKRWTPVGGECPIRCPYCYVRAMAKRFPALRAKYSGEPRLVGPWPKFKAGDVVFVCHMTDLFAMPGRIIEAILKHCHRFYRATYVFQTKVPGNYLECGWNLPPNALFGTTIESDLIGANALGDRIHYIRSVRHHAQTFITIEPIHRFSQFFADTIICAKPAFVNIGADSKRSGLPEPTGDEVRGLIAELEAAGIEVRQKPNLARLLKGGKR